MAIFFPSLSNCIWSLAFQRILAVSLGRRGTHTCCELPYASCRTGAYKIYFSCFWRLGNQKSRYQCGRQFVRAGVSVRKEHWSWERRKEVKQLWKVWVLELCVLIYACVSTWRWAEAPTVEGGHLISLQLKAVVSCPGWCSGTTLESSGKAVIILHSSLLGFWFRFYFSPPPPPSFFFFFFGHGFAFFFF